MTIGNRIKELRSAIGFTQTDLADKIGVSKQTLYKYENDIITNIPSDKIELMAHALNVSPAALMGWDKEQSEQDKHILCKDYDLLNDAGRKKLLDYANDLVSSGNYKKESQPISKDMLA